MFQMLTGGMALAEPIAYGYPGPPPGYAWAPLHPPNPSSESHAATALPGVELGNGPFFLQSSIYSKCDAIA